jgi:hypothetical protein
MRLGHLGWGVRGRGTKHAGSSSATPNTRAAELLLLFVHTLHLAITDHTTTSSAIYALWRCSFISCLCIRMWHTNGMQEAPSDRFFNTSCSRYSLAHNFLFFIILASITTVQIPYVRRTISQVLFRVRTEFLERWGKHLFQAQSFSYMSLQTQRLQLLSTSTESKSDSTSNN